jgi:hypothetical protein
MATKRKIIASKRKNKMKTKICKKCKEEKPLIEFSKNSKSKDKLQYACKICDRKRVKKAHIKYKNKRKEELEKIKQRENFLLGNKREKQKKIKVTKKMIIKRKNSYSIYDDKELLDSVKNEKEKSYLLIKRRNNNE